MPIVCFAWLPLELSWADDEIVIAIEFNANFQLDIVIYLAVYDFCRAFSTLDLAEN